MSKKQLQGPREGMVHRHRHFVTCFFIMAITTAVVLGPAGTRPTAANDAPVISGSTATYSGNQQPNAITQNNTSIHTIVVNNLTTNVGPQSTAISLTNMGSNSTTEGGPGGNSQPLTLDYSGGTNSLLGTNYSAYLSTTAGNGSEGAESSGAGDQTGKPGGAGGTGGSVTVTTSGAIQATTTGIAATSSGGTAGKGGEGNGNICKGTGGSGGTGGYGGDIQITSNGPVYTLGAGGAGILAISQGGIGGEGGDAKGAKEVGGDGGVGGAGGNVTITNNGGITTSGTNAFGISAQSVGGAGGEGHSAGSAGGDGGKGGDGGAAGSVVVTNNALIATSGSGAMGINAQSTGGGGGDGNTGNGLVGNGGNGHAGGISGQVTVNVNANITTNGQTYAVNAVSTGGNGGNGGSAGGVNGGAGNGGDGGNATAVNVRVAPSVTVTGGVLAESVAGTGGKGADSAGVGAEGGTGGAGGTSGTAQVNANGNITVTNVHGIRARSVGGSGGTGGNEGSAGGTAGNGGNGGTGGAAEVTSSGTITVTGDDVHGILATSFGGAGGLGGTASGGVEGGGDAGTSGVGGTVTVTSTGSISTSGASSYGIMAQSVGGVGGGGGGGKGVITWGGDASGGADGGEVTVNAGSATATTATISTQGTGSTAISAQSVGGGGGNCDSSGGMISLGGSGGSGGDGASATVNNFLKLVTIGDNAYGIQAQSVGGGGGNGGGTIAGGVGVTLAMGGSGAPGGSGGEAGVTNSNSISTSGSYAHGILAQSVGMGGGNGGYAISAGAGDAVIGMGGSAGNGGNGGQVSVMSSNTISTSGDHAVGILAESLGGGGGNGGYAIAVGTGVANVSMGGSGGSGGYANEVDVGSSTAYCASSITTTGTNAQGILAQSVGGGGGNGGYAVTAGIYGTVSLGASGGDGGSGGIVNVYNSGAINTGNNLAQGILAQSVGGGGGNGGFSFTGNITPIVSLGFAMGGKGGTASNGVAVTVNNTASISTGSVSTVNGTQTVLGSQAHGIFAQSVGGGGGNAGWAGTGTMSFTVPDVPVDASLAVSLGGTGGAGGDGGEVTVNNDAPASGSSVIQTLGDQAHGIFAQSVGGGGGSGGGSVAAALSFGGSGSYNISSPVSIGGSGGSGGTGGQVTVTNENAITTKGEGSLGILSQSLGGGGGAGGWSVTATLQGAPAQAYSANASVGVGGEGGSGVNANMVQVFNTGSITTSGQSSTGIEAQSVGGGGGKGGWSIATDVLIGNTTGANLGVTVGGKGGTGGTGDIVGVFNGQAGNPAIGAITTSGDKAEGILAQSIGGGGGDGGATALFSLKGETGSNTTCSLTPNVSVGGNGGNSGVGEEAMVTNYANIATAGTKSYGIFAQSVGGGGGKGGASHIFNLSMAATNEKNMLLPNANIQGNAAVGGKGGTGNGAGTAQVDNAGQISTQGMQAYGIFAQSVGGGGGVGGDSYAFNVIAAVSKAANANNNNSGLNLTESISVGGDGSGAGNGSVVTVNNSGAINTSGSSAYGIFAQSVGGGGGAGGSSSSGLTVPSSDYNSWAAWIKPSGSYTLTVGGNGGSCGDGGAVTVNNAGAITTLGDGAFGIYAQSLGGGGGVASYDQSQMFSDADNQGGNSNTGFMPFQIQLGGTGGAGGDGDTVQVNNSGIIKTSGDQANGIYAQSIGGGGGKASVLGGPWHNIKFLQYFGFAVDMGRTGGSGGSGGDVTVTNIANITTQGDNANGIFAQSVGGAGGSGSTATEGIQGLLWNGSFLSGASGNGGTVTVTHTGNIATSGNDSHGMVAQSVAGKDQAGSVSVTLNDPTSTATPGNIIATGLGSSGIIAQSLGAGGGGTINITINQPTASSGIVQGGPSGTVTNSDGSTTTYTAYGILIQDGQNNVLTNHGSVSTQDGANGTAVMVQADYGAPAWANLTINNYGAFTGSVNQGAQASSALNSGLKLPTGQSTITLNNYQGATFTPGATINLGGGTLTNQGTLSLGTVQSTLTGDFMQTSPGIFQTTLNGDGSMGSLTLSGTATLDGTLKVLQGAGPWKDGTRQKIISSPNHQVQGTFANVTLPASTPLVGYSLEYSTNPGVIVHTNVNSFTTVATNPLENALADHLDVLLAGYSDSFGYVLEAIQRMTAQPQFRLAFASLSPEIYGADTAATLQLSRYYTRTLQQRMEDLRSARNTGTPASVQSSRSPALPADRGSPAGSRQGTERDEAFAAQQRLGVWVAGLGQWGGQSGIDGFSGFTYKLGGTALGVEHALDRNLIVGANFGYTSSSLNLENSMADGSFSSLFGSLYGTCFGERAYLEGLFTYGNHQYDNKRLSRIGSLRSLATSSHSGNAVSLVTEAGYRFDTQQWTLQPFGTLRYTNLSEGSIQESGGAPNIKVQSRQNNSLLSEIGVRVERPIETSKGTLLPLIKVGWQHDYQMDKNTLPIYYDTLPVGTNIYHPGGTQDTAVIRANFSFTTTGGISTSIQYAAEVGGNQNTQGVMGQIRIPF